MTVLGKKTEPLRKVIENLNDVVQLFLNFLIDKIGSDLQFLHDPQERLRCMESNILNRRLYGSLLRLL